MRAFLAILFVWMLGAAPVSAKEFHVWVLRTAEGDTCRLSFDRGGVLRRGVGMVIEHDARCPWGPFWAYRFDGPELRLLGRDGGVAGRFLLHSENAYRGRIGQVGATMALLGTTNNPQTHVPAGNDVSRAARTRDMGQGQCLRYIHSERCADVAQMGKPGGPFEYEPVRPLIEMRLRQASQTQAGEVGRVAPLQCLRVRTCVERHTTGEVWCQISMPEGGNGWLLKQDRAYVYAIRGCPRGLNG